MTAAASASPTPVGRARATLTRIRISQLYRALTGREPRRVGADKWRGVAVWRGGEGLNVSIDDARGLWHDFTTGEGGGVLDLVVRVRGGSRQDALRWAANVAGIPIDNRPLTARQHADWAKQQRKMERELPRARLWRRAAVAVGEQVLDQLKAALTDPKLPRPEAGEIARWTGQLGQWLRLDGAALVAEYLWWVHHDPDFTGGLVYVAKLWEIAEHRALQRYLSAAQPERRV